MNKDTKVRVYCDGGSRGNPGPAASGVVIKTTKNEEIISLSEYLGIQTNNYAEYSAVILALQWLRENKYQNADFYLDSELVVRQLSGQYKVKNEGLKPLFQQIQMLLDGVNTTFTHVYRSDNAEADAMVNECLDNQ